MGSRWRVREGHRDQIDAVLALERRTPEAPHWSRGEYAAIFAAPVDAGSIRRCLFVGSSASGDEVLGFAVGSVWGAGAGISSELESVVVALAARRAGLGRALCEAVLEWCGERGAAAVELEVRSCSEGAIDLYRRLGFEVTAVRSAYYAEPKDDALLMRLRLPGVDQ